MIKTFHNKQPKKPVESQVSTQAPKVADKPKIKMFENTVASQQRTYHEKPVAPAPTSERVPSVLFSNKIKSIQSDLVAVNESFKTRVDELCQREFNELQLTGGDYLIIENLQGAIVFYDHAYQIEFGNAFSKKFQDVQAYLSDYAKVGKVDRILDLGQVIMDLAKGINIAIFNPNKLGTKISKLLGNRQQKVRKIKYEFDHACDAIDARVNRVFDNLQETRATLEQFHYWAKSLAELHRELQFSLVALKLKIEDEEHQAAQGNHNASTPAVFSDDNRALFERWRRKVNTLSALNQSIILTIPQIDLYRSNLLTSFERLEEIKVNIIQVWKQQFLTVIAVDESSDSIMYYELNDVQQQLIRNLEELQ